MAKHNNLGKQGEQIAVDFLKQKGFEILEVNWRWNKAELDIIAKHDHQLIFVEVKTRTSNYFEAPEVAITQKKQEMMAIGGNAYIDQNELDVDSRFDVITIIWNSGKPRITHFPEAFFPYP